MTTRRNRLAYDVRRPCPCLLATAVPLLATALPLLAPPVE
jgi:hypothetical protein